MDQQKITLVLFMKYHSLSIFLGGSCNLDCSYCFIDKENLRKIPLNIPLIKKGINFFLRNPSENPVISFTGGEPLLYWSSLKKLIESVRKNQKGKESIIIVSTNGTLLNKKKYDFLKKNNIVLSVSLDGRKNINDINRVFKDGKSSVFKTTWGNIKDLDKKKIKICSVFTPETVEYFNKNIKFFVENGFSQLDFYPEIYRLWSKKHLNVLKKEFDIFAEFYSSLNSNYDSSLEILFINRMLNKDSDNFCCQKLILGPDGNFYLCDKIFSFFDNRRKKYIIGNGEKGVNYVKRLELLKKAKREIVESTQNSCLKCSLENYCFCPIGLYLWCIENEKDFKKYFKTFCNISKIYISSFLKIKNILKWKSRPL